MSRFILLPYILNPMIHDTLTNTHKPAESIKDGIVEAEMLDEEHGETNIVVEGFIPRKYPGR